MLARVCRGLIACCLVACYADCLTRCPLGGHLLELAMLVYLLVVCSSSGGTVWIAYWPEWNCREYQMGGRYGGGEGAQWVGKASCMSGAAHSGCICVPALQFICWSLQPCSQRALAPASPPYAKLTEVHTQQVSTLSQGV